MEKKFRLSVFINNFRRNLLKSNLGWLRLCARYLWTDCAKEAENFLQETLRRPGRLTHAKLIILEALYTRMAFEGRHDDIKSLLISCCEFNHGEDRLAKEFLLLEAQVLYRLGERSQAWQKVKSTLGEGAPCDSEWFFGTLQVSLSERLQKINECFRLSSFAEVKPRDPSQAGELKNLTSYRQKFACSSNILVSVIFPIYNAQSTIWYAVSSILEQTHQELEVILVNDASTDGTREILNELAASDARIKICDLPSNVGAYSALNHGLSAASGVYVTTHGSDDWSHPQKLAVQLTPFARKDPPVASATHLLRVTERLELENWDISRKIIRKNFSSVLLPRDILANLGGWDTVRISGDAELLHRISALFGKSACEWLYPSVPLSFALSRKQSLTTSSRTHVSTLHQGLRFYYHSAFHHAWRKELQSASGTLALIRLLAPREIYNGEQIKTCPNVILVGDCRFKSVVVEMRSVLKRRGHLVGIFHRPEFVVTKRFEPCEEFFDLILSENIRLLSEIPMKTSSLIHEIRL